jgi:hypothetical protein
MEKSWMAAISRWTKPVPDQREAVVVVVGTVVVVDTVEGEAEEETGILPEEEVPGINLD